MLAAPLVLIILWFIRRTGYAPPPPNPRPIRVRQPTASQDSPAPGPDNTHPGQNHAGPTTAPMPPDWRTQAIDILTEAGPHTWLSTAQVREALEHNGARLSRQTVSKALADPARAGQIRTRGIGSGTAYSAQPGTGTENGR